MRKNVTHVTVAALLSATTIACGGVQASSRVDAGDGVDSSDFTDGAVGQTDDATDPTMEDATVDARADMPDATKDSAALEAGDRESSAPEAGTLDAGPDASSDSGSTLTCGALTTCAPEGGSRYCASTVTDNANCGACGHSCPAGTVCSGSACGTTCGAPFIECNAACVDGRNDPNHCGATSDCLGAHAGVQCAQGKSCVAGACVCDGRASCGGACVDTATDANNCGGCGNVCQGTCVNGGCATSCANLLALDPGAKSGTYAIDPDGVGPGGSYSAYCDMTSGGGWTLAMKVDGASASNFLYGSTFWTNATTLNASSVDLSRVEAKFKSFSQIVASAVRLDVVDTSAIGAPVNTQVIALQSPATLLSLVSGQYMPTALGRAAWVSLANNASLELNCNIEGFNVYFSPPYARARIGLVANQENDCNSPDSTIGFGVAVGPNDGCYKKAPAYGAGVAGGGSCAQAGPDKTVFGYVYVR